MSWEGCGLSTGQLRGCSRPSSPLILPSPGSSPGPLEPIININSNHLGSLCTVRYLKMLITFHITLRKGLSKVTFSVRGGKLALPSLPVCYSASQPATPIHAEDCWLTRDPSAQFLPLLKPSQASPLSIPLPPGPKDMLQLDVTECRHSSPR